MGVKRAMRGLDPVKKQETDLVNAGCYPIWEWVEFASVIPSFIEGDIVVAVSSAVFGAKEYPFITEFLNEDAPKKPTGPVPTLGKCSAEQIGGVKFALEKLGYPGAVQYCHEVLGIETDRHKIYHFLVRSRKKAKAIGNEGKDT